jgi:metallo-beta-lactamase class B
MNLRTSLLHLSLGALALSGSIPAAAQSPVGCNSADLLARFEQFGKTGAMPPELGRWLGDAKAQRIEPYKAFDNVWYVGVCWVSAWAVRTSEGVVLIDTVHEPHVDTLLDNLKKVGIGLHEIRYVLMTHGHFDHVGGAYRLQPLTKARFAMSQRGWDEGTASSGQSQSTPRPWSFVMQDLTLKDGESVTLGDTVFTLYETPGHTFGTASYSFRVRDGDKSYRAFTVGGLGLNAIQNSKQVEDFIASVKRIETMVKDPTDPITVHLTTHPFSNGLTEAKDRIPSRKPGEPHPLVDPSGFKAQLEQLRVGAEARLILERKAGR